MLAAQAPPPPPNPCDDPAQHLVCPNLRMPAPTGLVQVRRGRRSLLLMANALVNVGPGQLRFKGRRTSEYEMVARQVIDRRRRRSKLVVDTGARLRFKDVAGYRGSFWKFHQAARFELWDQDRKGHRTRVLGAGPKLDYCLRDLFPAGRGPRPPLRYGACSTDHSRRRVTLGISVRWADAYPAHYPENWIDVTGRRGCFTVVQRADPAQVVRESDETDNVGVRVVRLPYRPGRQRCPRHAGFVPPATPPAPAPAPGPPVVSPG
jgi:hypothetical protein